MTSVNNPMPSIDNDKPEAARAEQDESPQEEVTTRVDHVKLPRKPSSEPSLHIRFKGAPDIKPATWQKKSSVVYKQGPMRRVQITHASPYLAQPQRAVLCRASEDGTGESDEIAPQPTTLSSDEHPKQEVLPISTSTTASSSYSSLCRRGALRRPSNPLLNRDESR